MKSIYKPLSALILTILFFTVSCRYNSIKVTDDQPLDIPVSLENPEDWSTTAPGGDISEIREYYLQSFEMEKIDGLSERGVRPILSYNQHLISSNRATIPVWSQSRDFTSGGTINDYPEEGLTTSWTSSSAPSVGDNIFRITSITTYPADNTLLNKYTEEYYVKDVSVGGSSAPDGVWNTNDPIVDNSGNVDPAYRVKMEILFDSGIVRKEQIVKLISAADSEDGFAPFDINGSLYYPDFSYPATDSNANFSSIVMYTQDISTSHDYWFWNGTVSGGLLGIRYYTEHYTDGGDSYTGTTAAYERAIETYSTLGGTFAGQLDGVFVGDTHTTLAESVLRKSVLFDAELATGAVDSSAIGGNTVMRTHVVDTAGSAGRDFLMQQLNDDATVFHDWESAPYHVPSGTLAAEIIADDDGNNVVVKTELENPDGPNFPLISNSNYSGTIFSGLYQSIIEGEAAIAVPGSGDVDAAAVTSFYTTGAGSGFTIGNWTSVMDGIGVAEYDGVHGTTIPDSDNTNGTGIAGLNPVSTGSVEAWVYVKEHADYAGIVHKGIKHDFSDEGYTLQFWGKNGQVAFGISEQNPRYKYALRKSNIKLNTDKWYYLVGRWDNAKIYLDIYYDNSSGVTQHQSYITNNTLNTKQPTPDSGPLIIGSQYMENYGKRGYYGFNGSINGVMISDYLKSDAEMTAYYENFKGLTVGW